MSTKRASRKGGAPTPTVSTPGTSPRPERPPSPLSPTRASRADERRSMQNLNDRLAVYIDAVRTREAEIQNLKQERSVIEETHSTEIIQTKNMFNKEIQHLRKALDKTSNENSRLQINNDKNEKEAKEAKTALALKSRDLDKADRDLKTLQSSYTDLLNRFNAADDELKQLKPENIKLNKRLEDSKKNLEDETLKRIELQNQLMSLDEQHKFESNVSILERA